MSRDAVATAIGAVPRADFLLARDRPRAEFDGPLSIGHGQTNSQPRTVADTLRLLEVGAGQKVLDVGAGSGWTTAILAELVGPEGEVVGVERVPELVTFGQQNLARFFATRAGGDPPWARIVAAREGVLGAPDRAPFDRILVSAEAEDLPRSLVDQLRTDGRLVIPVHGRLMCAAKGPGRTVVTAHGHYRFVPLRR